MTEMLARKQSGKGRPGYFHGIVGRAIGTVVLRILLCFVARYAFVQSQCLPAVLNTSKRRSLPLAKAEVLSKTGPGCCLSKRGI